jgi:hypothetical protein
VYVFVYRCVVSVYVSVCMCACVCGYGCGVCGLCGGCVYSLCGVCVCVCQLLFHCTADAASTNIFSYIDDTSYC